MKTVKGNVHILCPNGTPLEDINRVVEAIQEHDTITILDALWRPGNFLLARHGVPHLNGDPVEARNLDDFIAHIHEFFTTGAVWVQPPPDRIERRPGREVEMFMGRNYRHTGSAGPYTWVYEREA